MKPLASTQANRSLPKDRHESVNRFGGLPAGEAPGDVKNDMPIGAEDTVRPYVALLPQRAGVPARRDRTPKQKAPPRRRGRPLRMKPCVRFYVPIRRDSERPRPDENRRSARGTQDLRAPGGGHVYLILPASHPAPALRPFGKTQGKQAQDLRRRSSPDQQHRDFGFTCASASTAIPSRPDPEAPASPARG